MKHVIAYNHMTCPICGLAVQVVSSMDWIVGKQVALVDLGALRDHVNETHPGVTVVSS